MKKNFMFCIAILLLSLISSCNKTEDQEPLLKDGDAQLAIESVSEEIADFEELNVLFSEIEDLLFAIENNNLLKSTLAGPDCRIVTVEKPDSAKFPAIVTIDFGEGCELPNGKVKAGKIIIHKTGWIKQKGSIHTTTFDNFSVDGMPFDGTRVKTCVSRNKNKIIHRIEADITIVKNEEQTINRVADRTIQWVEGFDTKEKEDDVFLTSGTISINRTIWRSLTKKYIEPVMRANSCGYALSGIVLFQSEGLPDVTINYGTGECDSQAVLSWDDQSEEIDLSGKWKKWK